MNDDFDNDDFDLEKVYDSEIAPLMTQIIEICKRERMPMIATFCYAHSEEQGDDYCTTLLPYETLGRPKIPMIDRVHRAVSEKPVFVAMTISQPNTHDTD